MSQKEPIEPCLKAAFIFLSLFIVFLVICAINITFTKSKIYYVPALAVTDHFKDIIARVNGNLKVISSSPAITYLVKPGDCIKIEVIERRWFFGEVGTYARDILIPEESNQPRCGFKQEN